MGNSVQMANKRTIIAARPSNDVARAQVSMKMPWQKAEKKQAPKQDTDSFKIEGDNSQKVKDDYFESAPPTPKVQPAAKKKGGNALSKYFDKLYENEPSQDTSKISGKDLIN